MVAAGGGGGFYEPNTSKRSPGYGGGLIGYDADAYYINSYLLAGGYSGHGATQQSVGISGNIELTDLTYNTNYSGIYKIRGYGNSGWGNYLTITSDSFVTKNLPIASSNNFDINYYPILNVILKIFGLTKTEKGSNAMIAALS